MDATRSLSQNKSNNDCYFYYYSTCTKGSECPFRHEPSALRNETMCVFWRRGVCNKTNCIYRHMEITKQRSKEPCYFETQPGGCKKPHCPFEHQNILDHPREEDVHKKPDLILPVKHNTSSSSDSSQQLQHQSQLSPEECSPSSPLSQATAAAITNNIAAIRNSIIVPLKDGESDSESGSTSPLKTPPRPPPAQPSSWELQKLREIQMEEAELLGYSIGDEVLVEEVIEMEDENDAVNHRLSNTASSGDLRSLLTRTRPREQLGPVHWGDGPPPTTPKESSVGQSYGAGRGHLVSDDSEGQLYGAGRGLMVAGDSESQAIQIDDDDDDDDDDNNERGLGNMKNNVRRSRNMKNDERRSKNMKNDDNDDYYKVTRQTNPALDDMQRLGQNHRPSHITGRISYPPDQEEDFAQESSLNRLAGRIDRSEKDMVPNKKFSGRFAGRLAVDDNGNDSREGRVDLSLQEIDRLDRHKKHDNRLIDRISTHGDIEERLHIEIEEVEEEEEEDEKGQISRRHGPKRVNILGGRLRKTEEEEEEEEEEKRKKINTLGGRLRKKEEEEHPIPRLVSNRMNILAGRLRKKEDDDDDEEIHNSHKKRSGVLSERFKRHEVFSTQLTKKEGVLAGRLTNEGDMTEEGLTIRDDSSRDLTKDDVFSTQLTKREGVLGGRVVKHDERKGVLSGRLGAKRGAGRDSLAGRVLSQILLDNDKVPGKSSSSSRINNGRVRIDNNVDSSSRNSDRSDRGLDNSGSSSSNSNRRNRDRSDRDIDRNRLSSRVKPDSSGIKTDSRTITENNATIGSPVRGIKDRLSHPQRSPQKSPSQSTSLDFTIKSLADIRAEKDKSQSPKQTSNGADGGKSAPSRKHSHSSAASRKRSHSPIKFDSSPAKHFRPINSPRNLITATETGNKIPTLMTTRVPSAPRLASTIRATTPAANVPRFDPRAESRTLRPNIHQSPNIPTSNITKFTSTTTVSQSAKSPTNISPSAANINANLIASDSDNDKEVEIEEIEEEWLLEGDVSDLDEELEKELLL